MASFSLTSNPLPSSPSSLSSPSPPSSPSLPASPSSPSIDDMFTCPVVPCNVSSSMLMTILHLQATHPQYYQSINTDFGNNGVESIVKWLNLMPVSSTSDLTCPRCANRPFPASASSLMRSHCIACSSRGFRVTICPYSHCQSYSGDIVEQIAHLIEKHPTYYTSTAEQLSTCGIDTVSDRVTLHTSLSSFPPGTGAPAVYVCFQCRVLLDSVSEVEGHLRHTTSHETEVIAQLEMHGRSGLADMLPMMFVMRSGHPADADAGQGNQEAEKFIVDNEQGGQIEGPRKRLKLFHTLPDIQTGKGSDSENSFDGECIVVSNRVGMRVPPASNYIVTNNINVSMKDYGNSKQENVNKGENGPTTPRKPKLSTPAPHKPRKRDRSSSSSSSFTPKARELAAVININLIDFDRVVVITNPVTLSFLTENITEYMDDDMRRWFKGITGSKKPPAWTGLSKEAWNGVWDEELWVLIKSRGEREFLAPMVNIEVVWGFDAA